MHFSPNIIKAIKCKKGGRVANMGGSDVCIKGFNRKIRILEELCESEALKAKILLKWTQRKICVRIWASFSWLRAGSIGRCL